MYFGAVASNGKVARPIFVETGMKINADDAYVELLQRKIKPWIDANFAPGSFIWQQDGASARTAYTVQEFLRQVGWYFWHSLQGGCTQPLHT